MSRNSIDKDVELNNLTANYGIDGTVLLYRLGGKANPPELLATFTSEEGFCAIMGGWTHINAFNSQQQRERDKQAIRDFRARHQTKGTTK